MERCGRAEGTAGAEAWRQGQLEELEGVTGRGAAYADNGLPSCQAPSSSASWMDACQFLTWKGAREERRMGPNQGA